MRIAFDARALVGPRTGVGVWLEGLLRGLAASTDWRFVLCLPRRVASLGLENLGDRIEVLAPPLPLPGTLWLHTLAAPLLAGRADVFVATLGVLPRRIASPDVLVVHDVTPRTRSGAHTLANRFCFNAYVEESLARAQTIVCVSQATRAAVTRVQPQAARRAVVIGEGVDPFFSPPRDGEGGDDVRARFASGRRFLLQLGTLEPRKGVTTLLAAHASLLGRRGGAPDLVLAGGRGWGGTVARDGSRTASRSDAGAPARLREPRRCARPDAPRGGDRAGLRRGGVRPAPGRGARVRRGVRGERRSGARRGRGRGGASRRSGGCPCAGAKHRFGPRAGGAGGAAGGSPAARRGTVVGAAARRVERTSRRRRP